MIVVLVSISKSINGDLEKGGSWMCSDNQSYNRFLKLEERKLLYGLLICHNFN